MSIETDADRLLMLGDWDTLTVSNSTINCVFDNGYIEVEGIASRDPTVHCLSSDVTTHGIANGVTVTVNAIDYTVRNIEPDGTGMSVLILEVQ